MTEQKKQAPTQSSSASRLTAAFIIGILGSLVIWLVTPYNNFIIKNSYISDSYLPIAAVFLLLLIIMVVNPLLRKLLPRFTLTRRQLGLIISIMLMASVLPGQGLLRMLPYFASRTPGMIRDSAAMAKIYEKMDLPDVLFPEKVGYGLDTPLSEYFTTELPPGMDIPWGAWVMPLISWGLLMVSCWLMMVGLALIVFPQWRRNERLAFPLLKVYNAMIDDPEPGRLLPSIFRSKAFWIACITVFVLHALASAKLYFPDSVPAIPLNWNLSAMFTEEPWNHLPYFVHTNRIYFLFVGIAFFMPNRIAFSIWFFIIAYAVWSMFKHSYFPPFHLGTLDDHKAGALFALSVGIIFVGRAHFGRVIKSLWNPHMDEHSARHRKRLLMFLSGCTGMVIWMLWIGVQLHWALFLLIFAFMVALVITRIVAETGMPFIRLTTSPWTLMKLAPVSVIGPVAVWMSYVIGMLFPVASRVSPGVMAIHGAAIEDDNGHPPTWRLGLIFVIVMCLGMFVAGSAHLAGGYRHSSTLDGMETPISEWGYKMAAYSNKPLQQLEDGAVPGAAYNRWQHLTFGAVLAGGLQWACLTIPKWPLHPIGLVMISTFYSITTWTSIFIGWLLKLLLIRYGGASLYRGAKTFFIGLIIGELFAAVFWAILTAIIALSGAPYHLVNILPT